MNEETLFHEVLAKQPAERASFLDQACAGNPRLRSAVEARLSAHLATGTLLHQPPPPEMGQTIDTDPGAMASGATGAYVLNSSAEAETLPPSVGDGQAESDISALIADRYRLVKKIGEGGMGEVWIADQTQPVKRTVALKLIKAGMDSKGVLARFEQERQALAIMDHPNIARVLDGGLTPARQPFFVMELVDGQPLTTFCDEHQLTPRQRLELFVPICLALQHAHQKGIVHRDLKPANILVTLIDGKPVPKVIDFGVAKAISGKIMEESLSTQMGSVVGTLEYMSPEQTGFSGQDVDTRADIYSLGVILYELLTGMRPIDAKRLKVAALFDMIRIIQEEEPSRPSTRLSTDSSLPSQAAMRRTEPGKLLALLQGEMDWVVMKCLEKQRDRRYETANGLARDIQRFLADEPVEARPPSARYRFGKLLRRNKGKVLAAGLVLLTLVGGIVGTSIGMLLAYRASQRESLRAEAEANERRRAEAAEADANTQKELAQANAKEARDQEREAKDQLALAEALTGFLQNDILGQASLRAQADRAFAPKPSLTIREALDRASLTISKKFGDRPRVEAKIRHTLGVAYREVTANPEAISQLQQALAIQERVLGEAHPDTLLTLHHLGEALQRAGKLTEAIQNLERLRALYAAKPEALKANADAVTHNLATVYNRAGRIKDAIRLYEQVRVERIDGLGTNHRSTLQTLAALAGAYKNDRRTADALRIYEQIREPYARAFGPDHPDTLIMLKDFASSLCETEQKERGLQLMEQTAARALELLGRDKMETLMIRQDLANAYIAENRVAEALKILEEVREDSEKLLGRDHFGTLTVMHNLGRAYMAVDRADEAIKMLEEVQTRRIATLGLSHPETIKVLKQLGFMYWLTKKFDHGAKTFAKVVAGCREHFGDAHEETCSGAFNLAFNYRDNGQPEEVVKVLDEWLPRALELRWTDEGMLRAALGLGRSVYCQLGRYDSAKPLFQRELAYLRKGKGASGLPYAAGLASIALDMLRAKAFVDAEPILRECLSIREKLQPDDWSTFSIKSQLGGALFGQKKLAEAEPLLVKGYEGFKQRQAKMPPAARPRLIEALERLVEFGEAAGKKNELATWKKELEALKQPKAADQPKKQP